MDAHRLLIPFTQDVKNLEERFHQNLEYHEMKVKELLERKGVLMMRGTALNHPPRICSLAHPPQGIHHRPPPRPHRTNPSPRVVPSLEIENAGLETIEFAHDGQVDEIEDVPNVFPDLFDCFPVKDLTRNNSMNLPKIFSGKSLNSWTKMNLQRCKMKRQR